MKYGEKVIAAFTKYEKTGDLLAFLEEKGMETGGTGKRVRPVVCCKGKSAKRHCNPVVFP